MIEAVGGIIGGILIFIGLIIIFVNGIFINHQSFNQCIIINYNSIIMVAIG